MEHQRSERVRAPGGWRRAVIGFAVGLLAGLVAAALLPREDGPRRRDTRTASATSPPLPRPGGDRSTGDRRTGDRPGRDRVARRLRPLTGGDVGSLPGSCASCLFWELGTTCPDPRTVAVPAGLPREDPPTDPVARKRAWVSDRVQEGTPPGRLVVVDGEVAGYALFGPVRVFARRRLPVPALSSDALQLATLWVRPVHREVGLGRLLLQAVLKEAIRIDAPAVEAYGDRRWRERACVLPATWLLHEGFEVHAEHPRTPVLRLDVRRAARWAGSLEHALEEILGRLPRRAPVGSTERVPPGVAAPGASGHRTVDHRVVGHDASQGGTVTR